MQLKYREEDVLVIPTPTVIHQEDINIESLTVPTITIPPTVPPTITIPPTIPPICPLVKKRPRTVMNLVPPCVKVSLQLVLLWEPGCWTPGVRTKNTVPTQLTHVLTAILVGTKL